MSNLSFEQWDREYSDFLFSSLNILDSWPSNLPLYVLTDKLQIQSITPDNELATLQKESDSRGIQFIIPEGKEREPAPPNFASLCANIGETIEGHILYTKYPFRWTENFTHVVGGSHCFGRCGKGCIGEGIPNNRYNRYTQRCFNHDGCVDELGYIASDCNWMFFCCLKDFYSAASCGASGE